jgi:hypothetical protein
MRRLRRHITYANVVSTIALVLAVGGGAVYAASKVGSGGIRKNAIHSFHIKNKQVKRQDIAGGSINSRKVSNESLTGKDIREATLGLVPSAADAHTVNGITERVVRASQPGGAGGSQVLAQGGLSVTLSCPGGTPTLVLRATAPGDFGNLFTSGSGSGQFDSATSQTIPGDNTGIASVRRADGTLTRLDFELLGVTDGFGSSDDCFLNGFFASGK